MKKQFNLQKKSLRTADLIRFTLIALILVLVNIVGSYFFTRFDLTSERRYSISDDTKKLLDDVDDIVFFSVYLEGEFPAGFKRLSRSTREMIDEFRAYNKNIEYEFINPSTYDDKKRQNEFYTQLVQKGLNPTELNVKTKQGMSKALVFPGAIASYRGREIPLSLLNSQQGLPPEEILNNSIQNLEFALADAIRKLILDKKPKIAFTEGHGELDRYQTADITAALREYYVVERVTLNEQLNSLTERKAVDSTKTSIKNKFDAIIIAKPQKYFSEKDKFIIDQFVMKGGKVLWLIDPVSANMDSLQSRTSALATINDLNLNDLLFFYGVRINPDLIMDLNALPIPIRTGQVGNQPKFEFFPWYYFPVVNSSITHPIVRNLNAIKTEFVSSLDTIAQPGLTKTILLTSSEFSLVVNAPVVFSLDMLQQEPDRNLFIRKNIPLAVLVEGQFESLFNNRIPTEISMDKDIGFTFAGESRMVVISDGDIIKNQMQLTNGNYLPLPLGYDRYTGQTFGNRELMLNVMQYLTDGPGLISIRSREVKLRMLDKARMNNERIYWQIVNVALPLLFIILFGFLYTYYRRKKYTSNIRSDQNHRKDIK